ncbi:MAG: 3-keto-disaccharide hydrolase [Pirellulales bacterium]
MNRPTRNLFLGMAAAIACGWTVARGAETQAEPAWRTLPLITAGKVDEAWRHVGWGGFVIDQGAVRTQCDPRGLGLLVYSKERFGNCQIRVVFKSKDAKSNAGVFVRIADGVLDLVGHPGAAFDRDAAGRISKASGENMQASAARDEGPWFAVHRGYEVQIKDADDKFHRTGAIYSLASSSAAANKPPGQWKTMIITLAGRRIFVDLEGQRVTTFDPESPDVPRDRQWFEPRREPARPEAGYLGLQNHDPGDVVWYKEISVRPLETANNSGGQRAASR